MFREFRLPLAAAALAAVALAASATSVAAQDVPRSSALAKELVALLTEQKRNSMAARDPVERDRFIAAMIYPGQLMVVAGRYTVPVLLDEKISFEKFMDVYLELNGAAVRESKIFIEDQFADGLSATRKQAPFDSMVEGDTTRLFDGDHRKAKLSKDEYNRIFAEAEAKYTKMLELLVKQAKASSRE
jgi:hypothetical protein